MIGAVAAWAILSALGIWKAFDIAQANDRIAALTIQVNAQEALLRGVSENNKKVLDNQAIIMEGITALRRERR
jgi:hypothetical protein